VRRFRTRTLARAVGAGAPSGFAVLRHVLACALP
jgi:hypothetical protein